VLAASGGKTNLLPRRSVVAYKSVGGGFDANGIALKKRGGGDDDDDDVDDDDDSDGDDQEGALKATVNAQRREQRRAVSSGEASKEKEKKRKKKRTDDNGNGIVKSGIGGGKDKSKVGGKVKGFKPKGPAPTAFSKDNVKDKGQMVQDMLLKQQGYTKDV
jgi:hypothetical protein